MLWSDYLAARSDDYAFERAGLRAVIDTLAPKTAVAVWRYITADTYPEAELFTGRSLDVFGASGEEDPENIRTWARYACDTRLTGMIHTSWPSWNDARSQLYRWPRKFWPFIQAGISFWDASAARLDPDRDRQALVLFDRLIGDVFPEVRRPVSGDRVRPLDLSSVAGHSLAEPGGFSAGALTTRRGGSFVLVGGPGSPAAGVVIGRGASLKIPVGAAARGASFLWACLSDDLSCREVGRLVVAGDHPVDEPLVFRRQLGNLAHTIDTYTGTDTGERLGPHAANQVFAIARPVFSAAGRRVLWQYDRRLDAGRVDSITVTAAPGEELMLVAISLVDPGDP
jgi:hypothetical protein